jgi:hypothetical protein
MPLVLIFLGLIFFVVAVRNSHASLFAALTQDVPAFMVWAGAILAIGSIGFIPGMKPVSRALLALVIMVLIVGNYQAILNGFVSISHGAPATPAPASPAQQLSSGAGQSGGSFIPAPVQQAAAAVGVDPTAAVGAIAQGSFGAGGGVQSGFGAALTAIDGIMALGSMAGM